MRCKKCKELSGIGGSAMTKFICQECGEEDWWCNTATPPLCNKCSEKAHDEGRCTHCGAEIVLKTSAPAQLYDPKLGKRGIYEYKIKKTIE
jgi:DNA-directed RNA polymerase subunit RPC12/RpoP